jgi:hypothetical protein
MNHEKRANIRSFARFFVQSHVTHPSLVKRWALNNFMGRSAEDSASSKHPTSTHGPNYRFPVPTKWTHFCRYCLSIARISWDIQLIFRRRMIPLQLQTSMWMDTKKNIFHRQLLGFLSGIFSWLMDVNGIASGKRSQFAKITIFKFATSTISTMASSYPLVNIQKTMENHHV